MRSAARPGWSPPASAFAGFRFPPEIIVAAVRWYQRFNLSYRYVEELLVERGVEVDHVTVFRWVQRFTVEVVTDAAPIYSAVLDELVPAAWHHVERHTNNPIEADHSQLKHRLRPMRGPRMDRTAQVIIAGHAFMQNLRRGHHELAVDLARAERMASAFAELALAI